MHYNCYDLFVCLFFMLKLLQYCNYIIIVIQIKLMLLLYMRTQGAFVGQKQLIRTPETGLERWRELGGFGIFGKILSTPLLDRKTIFWNEIKTGIDLFFFFFCRFRYLRRLTLHDLYFVWVNYVIMNIKDSFAFSPGE